MMKHRHTTCSPIILIAGIVIGILAIGFTLWNWSQFNHDAFPVRQSEMQLSQKRPQPKMPVTNQQQP